MGSACAGGCSTACTGSTAPMKRKDRAIVCLSWRRSTIISSIPCSSKNSLRWNPTGSFCLIVCSITLGPGKSNERLGLCDVEVGEHGEARRNAPGRRIGQNRDVGERRPVKSRQRRADLGHLHQRQGALHHPCSARAGDDHQRDGTAQRPLDRARDLLPDHDSHAAANEAVLHGDDDDLEPVKATVGGNGRVAKSGRGRPRLQSVLVGFGVCEPQRVGRHQTGVILRPLAIVEHRAQPLGRAHTEVMGTVAAHP